MPLGLDPLLEFQCCLDPAAGVVLVGMSGEAKGTDAQEALLVASELQEGSIKPVQEIQGRKSHQMHRVTDEINDSLPHDLLDLADDKLDTI